MNTKPIEKQISASLKITGLDANSAEFKNLNVPSSIGLGLPIKFTVPEKGQIGYAKMEYIRLLNKQGKPTTGLGIAVYLPDGSQKVVSVNSFFRSYYLSEPQQDAKDATRYITKGVERQSAFDILEGVTTMNFAPADLIERYFAGKTFEKVTDIDVFVPKYNNEHELIGYEPATKATFTLASGETKETKKSTKKNG